MERLKPCAHCGGRPSLRYEPAASASSRSQVSIVCMACGIQTASTYSGVTIEVAESAQRGLAAIWNRRTSEGGSRG